MTQAASDPKASFLQSSSPGSRKYCASIQGRKAIKQSYLAVPPMNHGNYEHGKI